jgi:hypothetical protein
MPSIPKQSMNGSKPLKPELAQSSMPPDPLDKARQAIEEGREATKLLDAAEDFDEPTLNGHGQVTVNLQAPSSPDLRAHIQDSIERPGVLTIALTMVKSFPQWGAVIVAVVAIVAYTILRLNGLK